MPTTDTQRRKPPNISLLIGVCLAALGLLNINSVLPKAIVRAQSGIVQWSAPLNLSNTNGDSTLPAIAADRWGHVHVFWLEKDRQGPRPANWVPERGDAIFYRQFDGQSWSAPIDIVATVDGTVFEYPAAAADRTGRVHLVWSGAQGLFYSSAHVAEASHSARNWEVPVLLASVGPVPRPKIVVDTDQVLHVAYAAASDDGNIYYLQSRDSGRTWSVPVLVSRSPDDPTSRHVAPQMIVDESGTLHLAWYEAGPPGWAGNRIWYVRSNDGGESWSEPLVLAEQTQEGEMQGGVNLASAGPKRIVAVWICGTSTHRCTRWSDDGGMTWNPIQRLFGNRASRAGWDAFATDAAGHAYLIVQLRAADIPNAVYYSVFHDGSWLDPPIPVLTEAPLADAHHPQMAVGQGNRLHVVLEAYGESEIYYLTATTGAPHELEPEALPSPPARTPAVERSIATPNSVQKTTATPSRRDPGASLADIAPVSNTRAGEEWPVLVGILPALLFVLGIIGVQMRRRRV